MSFYRSVASPKIEGIKCFFFSREKQGIKYIKFPERRGTEWAHLLQKWVPMFRKWTDEKGLVFLVNESLEARKNI